VPRHRRQRPRLSTDDGCGVLSVHEEAAGQLARRCDHAPLVFAQGRRRPRLPDSTWADDRAMTFRRRV
jgi:hypothetical protein